MVGQQQDTGSLKSGIQVACGEEEKPWIRSDDSITDEGKKKILKEIVAFANASGGVLVFGIAEKNACAHKITPIPNAEACVERFKDICRSQVEPAIPGLELRAIPTDGNAGVLVFRIPGQSPMAPHRNNADREFYIRRNESSAPMTVDEIRRHSISLQRRLQDVQQRLNNYRDRLASESIDSPIFECRCVVPTNEMYIPLIHRNAAAKLQLEVIPISIGSEKFACGIQTHNSLQWRIVRGTEGVSGENDGSYVSVKLHESGEIEIEWQEKCWPSDNYDVPMSWIVEAVANALLATIRLQRAASIASAEYTSQFHLSLGSGTYYLHSYRQKFSY